MCMSTSRHEAAFTFPKTGMKGSIALIIPAHSDWRRKHMDYVPCPSCGVWRSVYPAPPPACFSELPYSGYQLYLTYRLLRRLTQPLLSSTSICSCTLTVSLLPPKGRGWISRVVSVDRCIKFPRVLGHLRIRARSHAPSGSPAHTRVHMMEPNWHQWYTDIQPARSHVRLSWSARKSVCP